ncbi:MAG: hypothetical protein K0Q70_389 [Rhodospirillales bacterium]|jgi:tetratricopeptide (TPR) repeat protein|nr:hypothetical protein [Rhodospirillales bacterium]
MDHAVEDRSAIAIIGRLERAPWRRVAYELGRRRLAVQRHLSAKVRWAVVGHGATISLRSGRLAAFLAEADRLGIKVLSEHGFLRELGLLSAPRGEPKTYSARDIWRQSGLRPETIRLLTLFDVIDCQDDRYSFRDLKGARMFHEWAADKAMEDAICGALDLHRQLRFAKHLVELDLRLADPDHPELPLGDEPQPFDEVWENAVAAWSDAAIEEALASFRRCSQMRPKDAGCLVNLAMALERAGDIDQARDLLRRATLLEPARAEPWIDLAGLSSGRERIGYLERAREADPDDAITLLDLADAYTLNELYAEALPLWDKILRLTPGTVPPAKLERARKCVMLCRLAEKAQPAERG